LESPLLAAAIAAESAAFCIERALKYQLETSNPKPKPATSTGNMIAIMMATPPCRSRRKLVKAGNNFRDPSEELVSM
jgi:hypothetical protein